MFGKVILSVIFWVIIIGVVQAMSDRDEKGD